MSDGAVVPLRSGSEQRAAGRSDREPRGDCPLCGGPLGPDHPLPPHSATLGGRAPRLPDGLAVVLERTGEVSRRARAEKEAERRRVEDLAGYLVAQVGLFEQAMQQAGAGPDVEVRVGRLRGGVQRAWTIRHWRWHGTVVGDVPRTRHLYITAGGALYESEDDPGVSRAHGELPVVDKVDPPALLASMGELDAQRAVENVIAGLAACMHDAGVVLIRD